MNSLIPLDTNGILAAYLLINGGIVMALALAYALCGIDPEARPSEPDLRHRGKVPALSRRVWESREDRPGIEWPNRRNQSRRK